MEKVQINKERKVITYSDFWLTAGHLLEKGQDDEKGSYFMFLSSLTFSSFALEAFLNHIGESIFKSWFDLEKLSIKAKVNVICEKLEIKVNYDRTPWQIVPEIVGFRNKVAHGKNAMLTEEKIIPKNDKYEEIRRGFLFADWQNYAVEKNAIKVRSELEKLFRIIHKEAKIENDFLFNHGGQMYSAKKYDENNSNNRI